MNITRPLVLSILYLVCVGSLANVEAVSPPPDGSYPGANTAEGQEALFSLSTGAYNTGVGWLSLGRDGNTATGAGALFSNTSGFGNAANGSFALFSNTTGNNNTAVGREALVNNTTGVSNTAVGREALSNNFNCTNRNRRLFLIITKAVNQPKQ